VKSTAALIVCMALAGCGPDFRPAARLLADPPPESREPVIDRRRTYFGGDKDRPRREWHVLIRPGGAEELQGKDSSWYSDGRLEYEHEFDHDQPTGVWRSWYQSGQQRSEATFGRPEPTVMRWWYENGQLSSEGPALNGVKDGVWTTWHSNGAKSSQGPYVSGRREGAWSFWNEDGSLKESGEYRDDAKVGLWNYVKPL
jgi:hypothetical protein